MSKLDTMMENLGFKDFKAFEDEILETLKQMETDGLVGSYFDPEIGEQMWYLKEKLH